MMSQSNFSYSASASRYFPLQKEDSPLKGSGRVDAAYIEIDGTDQATKEINQSLGMHRDETFRSPTLTRAASAADSARHKSGALKIERNFFYPFLFNEPHLLHAFLALGWSRGEFNNETEPVSLGVTLSPIQDNLARVDEKSLLQPEARAYRSTGIWLRSSSIPMHDESSLRRVIHLIHFLEGMKRATDRVWPFTLVVAQLHDWIQSRVSAYPTWIGLFEDQDFLSGLGSWSAVGILLGVPFAFGIINVLRHWLNVDNIVNEEDSSPCCAVDYSHIKAMKLFWNGQIKTANRHNLFIDFYHSATGAHGLSQLYALAVMADMVDHLRPEDQNIVYSNSNQQEKKDADYFRKEARKTLYNLSQYKGGTFCLDDKDKSVIRTVYANYLRWQLGLMIKADDCGGVGVLLKSMFWIFSLYLIYAKFRYWERVMVNLFVVDNTQEQSNCENQGKKWIIFSEKGYAECTICGDWPVYLGAVQSSDGCWEGFLAMPQGPDEIIRATGRFINNTYIQPPKIINFNQQPWTNWTLTEWDAVLTALSGFEQLDLFNLSHPLPSVVPIDGGKMQRLSRFLQVVPTKQVDLKNQRMTLSAWKGLASGFCHTRTAWLDLSDTGMDDASASEFAPQLPASSLTVVNVASNQINNAGMRMLSQYMMNSSLGMLDVSANSFTAEGCDALFTAVFQHPLQLLRSTAHALKMCDMSKVGKALNSLTALQISHSYLEDAQFLDLASYLPNSTVARLDVANNDVTDYGIIPFVSHFSSHLQSLNLSGNQLRDDVLQSLILHWPRNLEALDISNNIFSLAAYRSLFQYLPMTKISALKMSRIKVEGAKALASVIPQMRFLEVLDLSECSLTSNATQVIMEALPFTRVNALVLSKNYINDAIAPVCKEIIPQTQLATLVLDGNYLTGATLKAISAILRRTQLRVIAARNNAIDDEAGLDMAQHLIAPISHPEALGDSSLSQEEKLEIYSQAKPVTQLTKLDLTGNKLTATSARALCRVWPATKNAIHDLQLEENDIDPTSVDISTCQLFAVAESKNSPSSYLPTFSWFSSRDRQPTPAFDHLPEENMLLPHPEVNFFPPNITSGSIAPPAAQLQAFSNPSLPLALTIIGGFLFLYWLVATGVSFISSLGGNDTNNDSNKDTKTTRPSPL